MATLATATRNQMVQQIQIDVDAGSTAGYIKFVDASATEIATCPCGDPSAGAAASGVLTFNPITDDSSATGGTIDGTSGVEIYDGDDTLVVTCSIATTSSQDFEISSLTIGAGDTVGVASLTFTMPAS